VIELIIPGGGITAAVIAARIFRVWWNGRVHRQNVDRVCTSIEKLAEAGYPVADAGEALRAISPTRAFTIGHVTQPQKTVAPSMGIVAMPGYPGGLGPPFSKDRPVEGDSSSAEISREVGPARAIPTATKG